MEHTPQEYKPSEEEQTNAEDMMTRLQEHLSKVREATYGQLTIQERAAWREMMDRADEIVAQLKKEGRLSRPLSEMLQNAANQAAQLRKTLEEPENK